MKPHVSAGSSLHAASSRGFKLGAVTAVQSRNRLAGSQTANAPGPMFLTRIFFGLHFLPTTLDFATPRATTRPCRAQLPSARPPRCPSRRAALLGAPPSSPPRRQPSLLGADTVPITPAVLPEARPFRRHRAQRHPLRPPPATWPVPLSTRPSFRSHPGCLAALRALDAVDLSERLSRKVLVLQSPREGAASARFRACVGSH